MIELRQDATVLNQPWFVPQWFCTGCKRTVRDVDVDDSACHTGMTIARPSQTQRCGAKCVLPIDGSALTYDANTGLYYKHIFSEDGQATTNILWKPSDRWPEQMRRQLQANGTWSVTYGNSIMSGLPSLKAVKLWARYRTAPPGEKGSR